MDLATAISSSPDDVLIVGNHGNLSPDAILRHLGLVCQDRQRSDGSSVFLLGGWTKSSGCRNLQTLSQLFIKRYRQAGLAANDRQTVLSHASHLLMVQLCLAEHSKQKQDLFDVDMSEVLLTSKAILQQKLSTNQLSCTPGSANQVPHTPSEPHPLMNMYEDMLKRCNMVDMVDVCGKVMRSHRKEGRTDRMEGEADTSVEGTSTKYVLVHPPECDIERAMLHGLLGDKTPSMVTVLNFEPSIPCADEEEEMNLSLNVSTERVSWDEGISTSVLQNASTPRAFSPTEMFCRQLFLSHLALLINTRDELSLAHCLSLPDKGLGLVGFTALRKAAQEKKMPMYQTMVSFIMKLRLGGKVYAPDLSSPLGEYVKPMGDFVTLMQKMHTLAEETLNPREAIIKILHTIRATIMKNSEGSYFFLREAIKKILHTIRVTIVKSNENVMRPGSLEKAAEDLLKVTDHIISDFEEEKKTPKKIVGQGRVIYGQKTIYAIRSLVDRQSGAYMSRLVQTQMLTDTVSSQKTPVKLPSIISQFRTPEVDCDAESPENVSLRDRLRKSLGGSAEVPKPKTDRDQGTKSFMVWADPVVDIKTFSDKPTNQDPCIQIPANPNGGLWADSPDDRTLAHSKRLSSLTPDLLDSIVATPKRKSHLDVEVTNDQEIEEDASVKHVKRKNKKNKEMTKKRLVLNELNTEESQPQKKAKTTDTKTKKAEPKPKKKKFFPQVKGQQSLSRFFSV